MIDMSKAYNNAFSGSFFPQPTFTQGRSSGADLALSWFFSRSKRWGVGLGLNYMQHTGTLTMPETFRADFAAVDENGRPFRQIISLNSPLYEDLRTSNLNVPLLLKYKWTFAHRGEPGGLGLTIEGGPMLGVFNNTKSTANGDFNYEAIYQIELREGKQYYVVGVDGAVNPSFQSLLFTRDAISGNDQAAFDKLRSQGEGWNVGLNLPVAENQREQDVKYNKMSIGALIQAGLSYHLSYHVAFNLAGYFMYQRWENSGNEGYRITDKVVGNQAPYSANYRPMTGAVQTSDYMSYGISAGFRFYFGGKRDLDGDGFEDKIDDCRELAGTYRGCPDTDGDGVPDPIDECATIPGPQQLAGCPDSDEDGVPDKVDVCPYEFGEPEAAGCPLAKMIKAAVDSTLKGETGQPMTPHIVLKTDVLYFDFGKVDLKDSAKDILDYAVAVLSRENKIVIHLSGHTDDVGSDRVNQAISYQRAKMASDYLRDKGIAKERIIIEGHGKDEPLVPNTSEENRAKNRRIDMRLLLPL